MGLRGKKREIGGGSRDRDRARNKLGAAGPEEPEGLADLDKDIESRVSEAKLPNLQEGLHPHPPQLALLIAPPRKFC